MTIMALLEKQVKYPQSSLTSFDMSRISAVAKSEHLEKQILTRGRTKDLYDSELHYGLDKGRLAETDGTGYINRGVPVTARTRNQV